MRWNKLFFIFCILMFSCEMNTGPEGPQGIPGNANVIIKILEFNRDSVNMSAYSGDLSFKVSEITEVVCDSGAVLAYFEVNGQWISLPYTFIISPNTVGEDIEINYSYKVDMLKLLFQTTMTQLNRSSIPVGRIKLVIMPPDTLL